MVSYTASDLAETLVYFTKTRTFIIDAIFAGGIDHFINQALVSSIQRMTMLKELWLDGHVVIRPDVIVHFLNATSTKLEILAFESCKRDKSQNYTTTLGNSIIQVQL
jgi:hypothetical protein